jgi:hypothetical protein
MKLKYIVPVGILGLLSINALAITGSFGVLSINNHTQATVTAAPQHENSTTTPAEGQGAVPLHGGGSTLDDTVTISDLQLQPICTVDTEFNDKSFYNSARPVFTPLNFVVSKDNSTWTLEANPLSKTPHIYNDFIKVSNVSSSQYQCVLINIVGALGSGGDRMGVFPTVSVIVKGDTAMSSAPVKK